MSMILVLCVKATSAFLRNASGLGCPCGVIVGPSPTRDTCHTENNARPNMTAHVLSPRSTSPKSVFSSIFTCPCLTSQWRLLTIRPLPWKLGDTMASQMTPWYLMIIHNIPRDVTWDRARQLMGCCGISRGTTMYRYDQNPTGFPSSQTSSHVVSIDPVSSHANPTIPIGYNLREIPCKPHKPNWIQPQQYFDVTRFVFQSRRTRSE